ncbi:MAG: ribosome maturation factor RimP [Candidatus Nitrohelix vancouverensis]|uniref:Ribosome maturation factor RimP n=1 Tax=Candidatus Nitrohelix vancouverensis TaxID=2705534 RepID=A0A7T0C4L8_9BACT|nr:MAG: ribosome maturation factor RimP [Candidatus Nitrohelix vancouverensis]
MAKSSISHQVTEIVEPIAQEDGLELVDVEYKKSGPSWILRIYIDKVGGITLKDCQNLSRQISDLVDINEVISIPYVLEVSSPGLDRPLKKERDFTKYAGKKIKLKTFSPIQGQKNFTGVIKDFQERTLFLQVDATIKEIPFEQISVANLVVEI